MVSAQTQMAVKIIHLPPGDLPEAANCAATNSANTLLMLDFHHRMEKLHAVTMRLNAWGIQIIERAPHAGEAMLPTIIIRRDPKKSIGKLLDVTTGRRSYIPGLAGETVVMAQFGGVLIRWVETV
ncbi:MAG: hypothetical protein LBU45_05365 [Azoarcus sp.]|jgi:hypothetical protein|nr:hypothetical protein [Azoarcus sp.]